MDNFTQKRPWHQSHRIPKRSRSIPVRGYNEDNGKYYRCWYCGFICDKDRDALSGSGGDGTGVENYSVASFGGSATLGGSIEHFHTVVEAQSDGTTAKGIFHYFRATRSGGCPLCGTLNWKGDY